MSLNVLIRVFYDMIPSLEVVRGLVEGKTTYQSRVKSGFACAAAVAGASWPLSMNASVAASAVMYAYVVASVADFCGCLCG